MKLIKTTENPLTIYDLRQILILLLDGHVIKFIYPDDYDHDNYEDFFYFIQNDGLMSYNVITEELENLQRDMSLFSNVCLYGTYMNLYKIDNGIPNYTVDQLIKIVGHDFNLVINKNDK